MANAVPTTAHLNRLYYELEQIGANCVGEKTNWPYSYADKEGLIALASDLSRFDPRLFEVLTQYFANNWQKIDPLKLRQNYSKMETPQTICVLCEFLKASTAEKEAAYFADYLAKGVAQSPTQFYFHNLYSPGGALSEKAISEAVFEFKKWGFIASERPVIEQENRSTLGSFDPLSRSNVLQRLLKNKKTLTLKDYLKGVNYSVSRQQALLDLKNCRDIHPVGKGRGAFWTK